MKRIIPLIVILTSANVCFSQNDKEESFQLAVRKVIEAFSKQNNKLLSNYLSSEIGVNLIHRVGVHDTYTTFKKINFLNSTYPSTLFNFSKGIKYQPIRYATLPKFDCTKESWNKLGLYVDTTRIDHLLSSVCKDRNKYDLDHISQKTIHTFLNLENNSRRIILIDKSKKELIFYLSYSKDRWYLTIVDSATSDCSV